MSRFLGDMTWPRFLFGWLAIIVTILGSAIAALVWFNVEGPAVIFGMFGALFVVASTQRPAALYSVVRNAGWFAAITNDRVMRLILLLLGLIFLGSSPFFVHLPAAAG